MGQDIIAIGASAGGVEALSDLFMRLPRDLAAAVFVVLHTRAEGGSRLAEVLGRRSRLPVLAAEDGARIAPGNIYVGSSDAHLLLEPGVMRLVHGPMENRHRPAIDPLFRSAALAYGERVAGVVLTGYLDDGSAGLLSIKRRGGVTIVQDPEDAVVRSMPDNAIEVAQPDHVVTLEQLPGLLVKLSQARGKAKERKQPMLVKDPSQASGVPSAYTCPECHGTLWEIKDGDLLRFHCRVGHAYSVESLMADQSESVERVLWAAMRSFEERADLSLRLAERAQRHDQPLGEARFREQADAALEYARLLRDLLTNGKAPRVREEHDPKLATAD